jgi:hypothetical protein
MRYILLVIIILQSILLGNTLGKTTIVKTQIEKNETCIKEIYSKDININTFFNFKPHTIQINQVYILAQSAIAFKYQNCLVGK